MYLSWYINKVVKLSPRITGLCLLSGQIADGITTPIVGVASDKCNTRIGKRMPWYYFGFVMVIPCFLGIFSYPPFINEQNPDLSYKTPGLQAAWYIILPALFNVGWAAVQISHMSIVNQLSYSGTRRDRMVNNRNAFTYAANITVLSFALLMFLIIDDAINQFRYLCLMCLGLGFCTSMFYMTSISEVWLSHEAKAKDFEY